MKVFFLGTGDAFGSGGRLQSCILVDAPDRRFLLDCGATALSGMKASGFSADGIRTIFITHLHGDHYAGLPFLIKEAQVMGTRKDPLMVAGPPGLEDHVTSLMSLLFPGHEDPRLGFWPDFITLSPGVPVEMDGIVATAHPAVHSSMSEPLSLRIACCNRVIAYSGDTSWSQFLPEVCKGADLFICEAFQYEKITGNHLDYLTLYEHRRELDCKMIILTHLGETMLDRCGTTEFTCAQDGISIEI